MGFFQKWWKLELEEAEARIKRVHILRKLGRQRNRLMVRATDGQLKRLALGWSRLIKPSKYKDYLAFFTEDRKRAKRRKK